MKFTVVGAGYVGLSLAILISQKYQVNLLDIDENKIEKIKSKISPIDDYEIKRYLKTKELFLTPTTKREKAFENTDFVVIATPTNYDPIKGTFDTTSVEEVLRNVFSKKSDVFVIIKSTVPLGFTDRMKLFFQTENIIFSPEFLREGTALYDNLYPSRIIIGDKQDKSVIFANIIADCSKIKNEKIKIFYMGSSEAEAVKLFSNTYLAMRVAFFNELDTFSQIHNISTKSIIEGVCSDDRIGNYYNNPSFGYGGYCLPKDTKQLLSNFDEIPNNIIKATIDSNETRKNFIVDTILGKKPKSIGIYRLKMKSNSDNFRESAIFDIIIKLRKKNISIYLYEPEIQNSVEGTNLIIDLKEFIAKSDLILANRMSPELEFFRKKVYTRDIFGNN